MDNCEQVLAAGLDLTEPLRTCPGLRLLVTSRERLHLAADGSSRCAARRAPARRRRRPRPPGHGARGRDARRAGALRAARLRGDRGQRQAVAEICRRLDGFPLALELAAARAKLFTPAELADRLRDRMAVLTTNTRDAPARHRTLRAAFEWSHDLLAEHERTVFRRLSVFVGAWTLEAAHQVCGDPNIDMLDIVSSLVDKSLVRSPSQGAWPSSSSSRACAQYAAELLAADDDAGATRDRHAAHFAEAAVAMEAAIGLPAESEWWSGSTASAEANSSPRGSTASPSGTPRPPCASPRRLAGTPSSAATSAPGGHSSTGPCSRPRKRRPTTPSPRRWSPRRIGVDGRRARRGALHLQRGLAISDDGRDRRRTAVASSFLGHIARTEGRSPTPRATTGTPPSSTARSGASPATRGRATTSACSPAAAATGRPRSASSATGSRSSASSTTGGRSAAARGRWPRPPARPGARRGGGAAGRGARPAPGGR